MKHFTRSLPILLVLTLLGCGDQDEGAPDDGTAGGTPPPTVPPDRVAQSGDWVVSPAGAGEVRVGMSLAELAPHLADPADTAGIGTRCEYLRVGESPDSVLFMVDGGAVARVDVLGGETSTAEGARVGDAASRILELYPTAVRTPHKYTDGYYLTVVPGAPADSTLRYVFEVEDERVERYRAGVYPQVEYVEGCS